MPDGKALLVSQKTGAAHNLFRVPLDGSKLLQLTHFDSEPLSLAFAAFSSDGKRIAVTRQRANTTDAVLFTNFR